MHSQFKVHKEIVLGPGDDNTNVLSKLSFWWTNSLLRKGYAGELTSINELYDLPHQLNPKNLHTKFSKATVLRKERSSLIQALLQCFGWEYFSLGLVKFLTVGLNFANPVLLHFLITFIQDKNESVWNAYYYAFGMFGATLFSTLFNIHLTYRMNIVFLKIRSSLITTIYEKVLKVSQANLADGGFSSGHIMNLVSMDTDRIINFCLHFHEFWSMPYN